MLAQIFLSLNLSQIYYELRDLLEGTYTLRIIQAFIELFVKIAPYLVISILIQTFLMQLVARQEISLKIKNGFLAILAGSLLGMFSPLPCYAAIPIGLSLLPLGVPFSAVMAFSIASPLINHSVLFLTITQLGIELGIVRVVATLLISVTGGMIFGKFFNRMVLPDDMKAGTAQYQRSFWKELWRGTLFFGKYFTVALLISAFVKAVVSPELVTRILGHHIHRSLLVAIAMGVPFYSCGGAAIPFVEVLKDMGMNKGAILSFFVAGPATKLATLYIYKSLLGFSALLLFLTITLVGAYFSGLLFLWLT